MSTKPNNRSDAALCERLEIARKATPGPWQTDEVVTRKKGFEPSYVVKDGDGFTIVDVLPVAAYQTNAAHIAANHPDVVRADIEEILRLRGEVKRLRDENEALKNSAFEFGVGFSTKVNEMRAREEWFSRELARLDKEADWLVKMLSHYIEDCPLKFSWLYAEELPIPKIDGCDGAWPDDDYFDCSNSTPEKCWREAARNAVEEKERHG